MIEKIEDSLEGGYGGLYGEVVTEDIYKLKQLPFVPTIIFDFGANVGIFTRYCQQLYPGVVILAVEPHPGNIEVFKKFTEMGNVWLFESAIGSGKVYRRIQHLNGAHESYLTQLVDGEQIEETGVDSVTVASILSQSRPWDKTIVKMDIEGNELSVFQDHNSMQMLRQVDYVSIELHHMHIPVMAEKIKQTLTVFESTHHCTYEVKDTMFYALKKHYEKIF